MAKHESTVSIRSIVTFDNGDLDLLNGLGVLPADYAKHRYEQALELCDRTAGNEFSDGPDNGCEMSFSHERTNKGLIVELACKSIECRFVGACAFAASGIEQSLDEVRGDARQSLMGGA